MKFQPINIAEKFATFSDYWAPKVIAEVNDYQFKLAKVKGRFPWHKHENTDEAFILLKGELTIEFRDGRATLKAGELVVVPKGVEHRTIAPEECRIMIIEPRGVINTGDAGGELTAENDVWI